MLQQERGKQLRARQDGREDRGAACKNAAQTLLNLISPSHPAVACLSLLREKQPVLSAVQGARLIYI